MCGALVSYQSLPRAGVTSLTEFDTTSDTRAFTDIEKFLPKTYQPYNILFQRPSQSDSVIILKYYECTDEMERPL